MFHNCKVSKLRSYLFHYNYAGCALSCALHLNKISATKTGDSLRTAHIAVSQTYNFIAEMWKMLKIKNKK